MTTRCARCGKFYETEHVCADLAKPAKPRVVAKPSKAKSTKARRNKAQFDRTAYQRDYMRKRRRKAKHSA